MSETNEIKKRKAGRPPKQYASPEEREADIKRKRNIYAKNHYEKYREEEIQKKIEKYKKATENHVYKNRSKYSNLPRAQEAH